MLVYEVSQIDSIESIYPVFYVTRYNESVLCEECARLLEPHEFPIQAIVNWENTDLYCDECSKQLQSAY